MRDFGEADKIVTLLTREEGKVQAVAKGARRPRNRHAAATQLFTHCQVQLFTGRNLDTLSQTEMKTAFRLLLEDLERMAWATYLCELVDETVPLRERVDGIFLLLLTTLHLLASAGVPPESVARAFELKLLHHLGFRPVLEQCAACGGALPQGPVRFSPGQGGALCAACHGEGEAVLRLSRGTLETMRHLLNGDLRRAHLVKPGPEVRAELAQALEAYITYRVEKPLKSLAFLRSVVDQGGPA